MLFSCVLRKKTTERTKKTKRREKRTERKNKTCVLTCYQNV